MSSTKITSKQETKEQNKRKQKENKNKQIIFLLLFLYENYSKLNSELHLILVPPKIKNKMTSNITCEVFEKSAAGLDKKCIARITVDGSTVKSTSHKHC
ncbi:MAG: hypothetical protein JW384_01016 [Nitrosomonadaceae bacterium]|nr:hypothetical protein [Nitrosomonadaceae bacterium]